VNRLPAVRMIAMAGIAGAIGATPAPAWAQSASLAYPVKPVRIVVPFSPGASTDTVARMLAQKLSETWGQQLIVDNRAGAGGSLGAELVARAEPDAYTLLVTNPGPSLNAILLRRKPTYGFRDALRAGNPGRRQSALDGHGHDRKSAREIVEKLNTQLNRLLRSPEIEQRFAQLGLDVEGGTPQRFDAFIDAQAKVLSSLIARGTLQPE
jgi:tripartite-type tricarboxylate transporter receptor subunit TctC